MTAGASNSPVFDFTSLDQQSVDEDLIRYAQTTFPEELWTDYNDSNVGTGLIGLMSYASDLLAYTANAQNLETVVTTLVREQNFRNIAKSLDYTLKSASASSTTMELELDPAGVYPFTLSKHVQFSTPDNIIFQPDADQAVAAYAATIDVAVTAGTESFQEALGTTNGLANQQFALLVAFLIDDTLQFQIGLDAYTIVPNFISAGSTDKVAVIQTDENGITTVIVGDGVNGTIPPRGQSAVATYKTGGGADTNLAAGTVTRLYGTSDGSALPAQILSVTNSESSTGGASKQSLVNAKQNLPLSLKANDRCVSLSDYSTEAVRLVSGILKANAVAGRPLGGSIPVLLFVVPNGGGNPSDSLRNLTIVSLKDKRMAGKRIRVLDPVYVNLIIESDTFIQANSPAFDTANKQRTILTAKYDIEAVDFAASFDIQEIYDDTAPSVISGIRRIFYKTFSVRPYYGRHVNTSTTGSGTVEWIDTNLDLVKRREWLVQVLPPLGGILCNRFQVLERRLGTVTSVTDSLVTDDSANYTADELFDEGWSFHPLPEESTETFEITGNTTTSITTEAGLLLVAEPDDPYVVEKLQAGLGKILRTTTTTAVVSSAVVPVASVDSWEVGDILHLSDNLLDYYTVGTVGVASLTLDRPVSTGIGVYVDYVWQSSDESVQFAVIEGVGTGSSDFVTGDELYVDTYPRAGDIALRPENFPLLEAADLFINTIGGVR